MFKAFYIFIVFLIFLSSNSAVAADAFWGRDGGVNYALKAYNHIKDNCAKDKLDHLYKVLKLENNPQCKLWDEVTQWKLKWYIASDDDTVVITFRGTANDANKKLNQRGMASTKHRGLEGVLSHEGWANAVDLIWNDINIYLAEIKAQDKRMMVTGHSLGGPLSGYTMFRLLRAGRFIKGKNDVLVTTGSPRYAGAQLCIDPVFAKEYAERLLKTGTAAFSVEMWHDPTIYTWTDGNPLICTASRIGFSVNFDPRDDPDLPPGKTRNLMESVAGNYCDARSVHPKPINFHNHQRYTRIGALKKDQLAIGFSLWPGDICVSGLYDHCVHGKCVGTIVPGLSRCAQRTVVPETEEKKKGCNVVPDGKKWPKRHWLRHRIEFPQCGGLNSDNSCPPYHKCSLGKILHCVPK